MANSDTAGVRPRPCPAETCARDCLAWGRVPRVRARNDVFTSARRGKSEPVLGNVVFPGHHATSKWAWVLLCIWFFAIPLTILGFAAYSRLSGKPVPGLANEDEEDAQVS